VFFIHVIELLLDLKRKNLLQNLVIYMRSHILHQIVLEEHIDKSIEETTTSTVQLIVRG
jgi:hypothetical protein